jgi:hypothetical protein
LAELLASSDGDSEEMGSPELPPAHRDTSASYRTTPNNFGVYREYLGGIPSYTPDEFSRISDRCDAPTLVQSTGSDSAPNFFSPYKNVSTFRLMHWYQGTSILKSLGKLNRLVKEVILAEDFCVEHLNGFSAGLEAGRIDTYHDRSSSIFSTEDGWIQASVSIPVPVEKGQNMPKMTEATAPRFEAHGLLYRKITTVVQSALKESSATQYHLSPFKEFWQSSPHDPVERLYSEIYTSDVMIEAHQSVQNDVPGCTLEKVVIPLMLWSDATLLASFGNASLWPVYLFLGNLSKYVRGKPSSFSAHHIAYIPKVAHILCILLANLIAWLLTVQRHVSRLVSSALPNVGIWCCPHALQARTCPRHLVVDAGRWIHQGLQGRAGLRIY